MAPEPISRLLGDSAELRSLARQLRQIRRLQNRYRTLVPEPLAQASRVCAIDGKTVVIGASSGPVASALRHLAPRVLDGLRDVRWAKGSADQEFNSIRVEVQVAAPPPRRTVVARPPMPRDKLAALAGSLSESPLREALERIAGDQAINKTRSKR